MNRLVMLGVFSSALVVPVFADQVVFNNPSGTLGASQSYTLGTTHFTATGFNGGSLYGKNNSGDEKGLGLTNDFTGDNEIYYKSFGTQDFIQLDIAPLLVAGYSNFTFSMNSTTGSDAWLASVCSTNGVDCGTSSGAGSDEGSHALSGLSATNHYIDFSATSGNVLLNSLSATMPAAVPEPASVALLGTVLLGVLVNRKTRRSV